MYTCPSRNETFHGSAAKKRSENRERKRMEKKIEMIYQTVEELLEKKKKNSDQDEDYFLLSRLLSQVELLKEDCTSSKMSEPLRETTELPPSSSNNKVAKNIEKIGREPSSDESKEMGTEEEIVKELKKVKKQNTITHCLLSAVILLTVVWQYSEVSFVLSVKHKLSNPFRSIGDLIGGAIKNTTGIKVGERNDEHDIGLPSLVPHIETPTHLPELKVPHMNLPALGLDDPDED